MNIPPVPREGWTPAYLRQLRDIANEIQFHPTLQEHVDWLRVCRKLTEEQLDELFDATLDSFQEYQRVQDISMNDKLDDPQLWVDYLVADRCHQWDAIQAAKRLFGDVNNAT